MAYIYKRGKTWYYRISNIETGDKRRPVNKGGFRTKTDAQKAATLIESQMIKHDGAENQTITFANYFREWIKLNKLGRYSSNTDIKYNVTLKLIESYFDDIKLKDVTKYDYQKMLDEYSVKSVLANGDTILRSRETVGIRHTHIQSAVHDAIDEGILYKDFTRKITLNGSKPKSSELKYLEVDEVEKLKKIALERSNIFAVTYETIVFGIQTGARYGEIIGMTWDCINFKNKTVTINKTYDYINRTGFHPTKTVSSIRTISIDSELVKFLKRIKVEQNKVFMKQGFRNPDNLVFINNRHLVPSNNAAVKVLRKVLEFIGAKNKDIGMHGLRHTHASMLFGDGASIYYVSERLGHKDISVTQQTYTHLLKDKRQEDDKRAMYFLENL